MDIQRHTVLRDWIALVLILVVVPLSVFGGTNVACVGQGISEACTPQSVFLSPLLLMVAGVIAGLITSGWTGLLVVGFGQIAGQVVVLVMSYVAGRPVPIDPFSAIIATLWFGVPIAIGYGLARLGSRIVRVASGPKRAPEAADAAVAAAAAVQAPGATKTPEAVPVRGGAGASAGERRCRRRRRHPRALTPRPDRLIVPRLIGRRPDP